uniref:Kinetochore protein NDC80 n=1 Tax=Caenorhabditis tropicalis TaxID=1561998 RepID=A0A1I7UD64_9PELO
MYGSERRKTGAMNLGGRTSMAITPSRRFTDVESSSVRRSEVRPSLMGSQARPSIFGKGSTIPPRDVKSMIGANVEKIWHFLVEHDQGDAPSDSVIRNPQGKKDFVAIFESIYQHMSKDYEFPNGGRLEEEITPLFKALGYPYPLKDSYFKPIGATHGWPHLLDALGWLVDLVRIMLSVKDDTQNIMFGDFPEATEVHERALSYSWHTSIYREYTNDRKVIESKGHPFWEKQRAELRNVFDSSNEYGDMTSNYKNALEQLKFECDEIESERGQEANLLDEIARMKDDIRKAAAYQEQTENVKMLREADLEKLHAVLREKMEENQKMQKAVNELKERIEKQRVDHGLNGKQVRQMNLENSKDKEMVSEIQAELDKVSKETWMLNNENGFRDQKLKFLEIHEHIIKTIHGLNLPVNLPPLKPPSDELELKSGWETLTTVWIPDITRHLHQKKLELENEQSRFADRFAAAEERLQIENEMLEEAKKREQREERTRQNERSEWKTARQRLEKESDELENQLEVLKKQMQIGGNLEMEIEEERRKMKAIEEGMERKNEELIACLQKKLDEIFAATVEIENEKLAMQKEFEELEAVMQTNCH